MLHAPSLRARPVTLGLALAVALSACSTGPATAQDTVDSQDQRFRVETVATGVAHPWGMAFLPNGDILVTERPGRMRLIRNGQLQQQPVAGTPEVWANGQGGLLDVALHPQFAQNLMVYITYSKSGERGATTALARARWENDRLNDLQDIFVAEAWGTRPQHFGSRIVFDGQGMLFMTIGERNERNRAQDPSDHAGTTIRLHDDGRVPQDNPFVGRQNARPEIWSYGHRNAQGMAVHPQTGEIWQNEHGPRGGDEINIARAGRNYGWPLVTHGREYSGGVITQDTIRPGIEPSLLHWTPSIAPSGMIIYRGDRFPQWRGNVFSGALAGQHLRRVVFDGERPVRQESLLEGRARIRHVAESPDGYIYLLTDASDAQVLRLVPAN